MTFTNVRLALAAAALAVVAGTVTGCSGSSSPAPVVAASSENTTRPENKPSTTSTSKRSTESTDVTEAPDACDLITEDDAADAFGEPAVAGDQRRDECWWSSANDLKIVNIIRRTPDIDEWRQGYQNDHWEEIDMGDEAYAGKTLDSITFRLGETIYEINVVYSTTGDPEKVVTDLADTVISRL